MPYCFSTILFCFWISYANIQKHRSSCSQVVKTLPKRAEGAPGDFLGQSTLKTSKAQTPDISSCFDTPEKPHVRNGKNPTSDFESMTILMSSFGVGITLKRRNFHHVTGHFDGGIPLGIAAAVAHHAATLTDLQPLAGHARTQLEA